MFLMTFGEKLRSFGFDFVHVQIFVICDKEIADEVLLGSVLMWKSEKKPPFNVIDV